MRNDEATYANSLAAPYQRHDFKPISGLQNTRGMSCSRYELPIAFDGYVAWLQSQVFEQLGHGAARLNLPAVAVDRNFHVAPLPPESSLA